MKLLGEPESGRSGFAKYRTIASVSRYVPGAFLVFAAACGGGGDKAADEITGPPPPAAVTLSFTLQQVNGQTLPASFQTAEGVLVITSGSMVLRPELTFSESILYNLTAPGASAVADTAITTGTYAQTGTDIVFTVPPSGSEGTITFSGTVVGNTLTYNDAGFVAVYRR